MGVGSFVGHVSVSAACGVSAGGSGGRWGEAFRAGRGKVGGGRQAGRRPGLFPPLPPHSGWADSRAEKKTRRQGNQSETNRFPLEVRKSRCCGCWWPVRLRATSLPSPSRPPPFLVLPTPPPPIHRLCLGPCCGPAAWAASPPPPQQARGALWSPCWAQVPVCVCRCQWGGVVHTSPDDRAPSGTSETVGHHLGRGHPGSLRQHRTRTQASWVLTKGSSASPTPRGTLSTASLSSLCGLFRDPCKRSCPWVVLAPHPFSRVLTRLGPSSIAPSYSLGRKVCPQIPLSAKLGSAADSSGGQRSAFGRQSHGRVSVGPCTWELCLGCQQRDCFGVGP